MLIWLSGYDVNGKWNAINSKNTLAKFPLNSKKSKPKSTTTNKTSGAESDPLSPHSTSTKSRAQKQTPPDLDQSSQSSSSHRISRHFPLNLAHAVPTDPDRLFIAFFVPYDGHCLFNSFISSLQLRSTVQELRTAVVRNISEVSSPQIRISALNTHIAREQDHHNPAWQDVDLLDAGTVFMPGEMDITFSHLWVRYSDEMSHNSWAGTHISFSFPDFQINLIPFQASLKSWLSATSTPAIV